MPSAAPYSNPQPVKKRGKAASYFSLSRPLIQENLRRYWVISVSAFLAYFLSGVFPLLLSYGDLTFYSFTIESMLRNYHPVFMTVHLFMPIITGVVIFRYLQTTAAVSAFHAMPFTRVTLFNSHMLSGLILITAPLMLTGAILLLIAKPVYRVSYHHAAGAMDGIMAENTINVFTREAIALWMWESFVIILVLYAVTVFAGLVTGHSGLHLFAGFGFNFLFPALLGIITLYCLHFLYGFAGQLGSVLSWLSPYIAVFSREASFPWLQQIVFVGSALLILALSMALYQRRKLERASDAFVFDFMIPVVAGLIAFFGMSLFGFYFQAAGGNSAAYFYAGLLFGAALFYLIGRMVAQKTFRVFNRRTLRGLGAYLVLAAVFVSCFAFDLTGFEKRIPAENRIGGVTLTRMPGFPPASAYNPFGYNNGDGPFLTSEKNVAAFRAFHSAVLENRTEVVDWENRTYTYTPRGQLLYSLNGPFDLFREYTVDWGLVNSSPHLAQIFESEEYKAHFYFSSLHAANQIPFDAAQATVTIQNAERSALITGRNDLEDLLVHLDLDFKTLTYADAISFLYPYATLNFAVYDDGEGTSKHFALSIPRSYQNTIAWLETQGYAEQIAITPDMIASIIIWETPYYNYSEYRYSFAGSAIPERTAPYAPYFDRSSIHIPDDENILVVTDKDLIALVLETCETSTYTRVNYEVQIIYEPTFVAEYGGHSDYGMGRFFSDEALPAALRPYVNN